MGLADFFVNEENVCPNTILLKLTICNEMVAWGDKL